MHLGQFPSQLTVVSLSQEAIKHNQGNNNQLIDSYHSEVDYSLRQIKNIITQLTLDAIGGVLSEMRQFDDMFLFHLYLVGHWYLYICTLKTSKMLYYLNW